MTIFGWIKNKILSMLKIKKLDGTPNNERFTYVSDPEAIRKEKIRAFKVWAIGDGDELLNWYTNQQTYGWLSNPIYNRNKRQFFWGIASIEEGFKRIHSGVPKAIKDTIVTVVGKPTIECDDPRLPNILKVNNFYFKLKEIVRPGTLTEGDGCWKLNLNPAVAKVPLFEWYGAEDWEPVEKNGILFGLIFKTYYQDPKANNYVLFETRSLTDEGCLVEYQLYKFDKTNELTKVDIDCVPKLAALKGHERILIEVRKLFAVPTRYYIDPLNPSRGKSIYEGKLDLFDMLDEIISQAGQTNRVSTPVEYYDTDLLERTKDGQPIFPSKYNRQYIKKTGFTDGDGNGNGQGILTTQPQLNFDQYGRLASDILSYCLLGILSPSSLGIDVAKKDNADAQREKEKQTIFTRDAIIANETEQLQELLTQALILQDYLDTGMMMNDDYNISIKYDEFANPAFETELGVLGPAWSNGQLSTERYVSLLWAGKLSDEEQAKEVAWLDENKAKDDFDLGALDGAGTGEVVSPTGNEQETIVEAQE